MRFIVLLALIGLFGINNANDITCLPSDYALSKLVSGVSSPTVNVTVMEYNDRYVYSATGYTLSYSDGGPTTSRGMLIIPDEHIHGGSYSPYAWYLATIGHHVVIMKSITGISDHEIFGNMINMMETELDLHAWALLAHGRGAKLASKFASIDNGSRVKSVVVLGSDLVEDFSDNKRQVVVAYGLNDTISKPEDVQESIRLFGSYETNVNPLPGVEHLDFAYSRCSGNSYNSNINVGYRFENVDDIPVFKLPIKNGKKLGLNPNKKIVADSGLMVICRNSVVSYYDNNDNMWIQLSTNTMYIESSVFSAEIEVNTGNQDYNTLINVLNNKLVKLEFICGVNNPGSLQFYISDNDDFVLPASKAQQMESSLNMLGNLAMGLMAWRDGDARGKSFPHDRIISIESTNPLVPIETRWYVWENETATRGIIFHVGGALHPSAYGGISTLFRRLGYTVVIPAAVSRFSMLAVGQGKKIVSHSDFDHIQHWTLSGSSQGAFSAAMEFAYYPDEKYDSIIMYAGVLSTINLSQSDVLVANIYGTHDTVNPGGYQRYKDNFGGPYNVNRTHFILVDEMNHCYTGDYNYQEHDSIGNVSRDEQQRVFSNLLHDLIKDL